MAVSSLHTAASGTFSHLMTTLIIAVVFNSYAGQGRLISNHNGSIFITDDTDEMPTTIAASFKPEIMDPIAAYSPAKTSHLNPFTLFMNGMTNPLREDDVEYGLDYYSEKALIKEYNFDSLDMLKLLINSAMSQNTTPAQFLEEIQDLISLQNRSRAEQNDNSKGRDEVPVLPSGFLNLNENLMKSVIDGWKNELKRLEKKYNISSECTGPDSITATRLALMFPHYMNFGQKPFAVPSDISLQYETTTTTPNYYDYGRSRSHSRNNYELKSFKVPAFFKRQEFGGLIPLFELDLSTRKAIIGVHLYALHRDDMNGMEPFRMKCALLKWRMEKSVLSDVRRMRFLRNNEIIDSKGQLLKTSIISTYDNLIPSDFKDNIEWSLLGVSSPTEKNRSTRFVYSSMSTPPSSQLGEAYDEIDD